MDKKKILTVFAVVIFQLLFCISAYAGNIDEYYKDSLEAIGADELSDYLDGDTLDYLEKIGCGDIEFEKMLEVSPKTVFELIFELIKNGFELPMKGMLTAVGTVMLVSVCAGFFPDDEKSKSVLNLICGCILITGVFSLSFDNFNSAVSAMGMCVNFEKALIPILAALVTAGGNPTLALTFKGAAFAAAEFISNFSKSFALPLVGISGSLGITGAMLPTLRLSAISEIIRKTVTFSLSTAAGLFTGFLSLKGLLASSADGIAMKGVKLAANTFIPVVGGAIGEAYSSVLGSISLLKNTVGIYAIIAFFAVCIPVIISLALWIISMRVACAVSDLLGCGVCSEILKNIAYVFSTVNAMLLLCLAVFVISAGLMVVIKTGG